MFKFGRYVLTGVIMLFGTYLFVTVNHACNLSQVEQQIILPEDCLKSDIIKTVSHINLEEDNNLELIYTDTDNDIAYYRFKGDRDLVNIGDVLTTCYGDAVTVTYCDVYGFRVNNSQCFSPGMSGTALMDKNSKIVGFVSELLENDEVYCIWN